MLGSDRILFALALTTTMALGCGGDSNQSTGGGGTGGSTTTSSTEGGTGGTTSSSSSSSSVGGAITCDNGEATVLGVSNLSFGEGQSGQWKKVGYNIDGLTSNAFATDVCKPNSNADPSVPYPDGDDGIDNSFGKNLLPIILSLYPNWVDDINNGISNGVFTSLLKLECLPAEGDVPVMVTKLFGGEALPNTAKFDGSDVWPVQPELLSDPMDPDSSTVVFNQSSVIGQHYDAGPGVTFILTVPLKTANASTSIKLTLYSAKITMTLAADRKSATEGLIGGVLNAEELVAELKKVGALMNLCDTSVFNDILTKVRQAADIMTDGTQDPNATCDGISLGLGFVMKPAQLGEVGPPVDVGDACQ